MIIVPQNNPGATTTRMLQNFYSVPFRWLSFVYAMTYTAANTADTLSTQVFHMPTSAIPVLVASTTVNTVACIAKDAAFAKLYGTSSTTSSSSTSKKKQQQEQMNEKDDYFAEEEEKAMSTTSTTTTASSQQQQKQVPAASYVVWLMRDILTAFSAFTLPPLLMDSSFHVPAIWSRLAGPVIAQYVTTPLHLTGLAMYNLQPKAPAASAGAGTGIDDGDDDDDTSTTTTHTGDYWRTVITTVLKQFPDTVVARQLRILPAFSFGGIANSAIREWAQHYHYHTTTIHVNHIG